MIRDLTNTLVAILEDAALGTDLPELAAATVVLGPPNSGFTVPAGTPAVVDLFLYDINENLDLRSNEPRVPQALPGGALAIELPPRRIDCSYLVTAWPAAGVDLELREHRLLSQVLQVLGGHPTIPAAFLQGSLVGQEPPLPLLAPRIDGLSSPAEFWTAMGNDVRASFTVTATVSIPILPVAEGLPVTTVFTGYRPIPGAETEILLQIGGDVKDANTGNSIRSAIVEVPALGLRESTNDEGQYIFNRVRSGSLQFRVSAVGYQAINPTRAVTGPPERYRFELVPLP